MHKHSSHVTKVADAYTAAVLQHSKACAGMEGCIKALDAPLRLAKGVPTTGMVYLFFKAHLQADVHTPQHAGHLPHSRGQLIHLPVGECAPAH